jgi:hypothetical protein
MSRKTSEKRALPPAARVFGSLQADDALLPGHASALRRSGALFLMLMVLVATPLYFAANAAGLIGDTPAALAKGGSSGPGGGDDDDSSGPGGHSGHGGGHDDSVAAAAKTDDTSANGHSTRGTTNDNDTHTNTGHSATGAQTRTSS